MSLAIKLENIQIANANKYGNEGLKGDDDRPKFGPLDSLKGARNVEGRPPFTPLQDTPDALRREYPMQDPMIC